MSIHDDNDDDDNTRGALIMVMGTQKRSSFLVFEKSRSASYTYTFLSLAVIFFSFPFLSSVAGWKKNVHADNNVRVVCPRGILQSNVTDSVMQGTVFAAKTVINICPPIGVCEITDSV